MFYIIFYIIACKVAHENSRKYLWIHPMSLRHFHVQVIFTDIIAPSFLQRGAISERDGRVGG